MHTIRDLRDTDIPHLAANLRSQDVMELMLASGSQETERSLRVSVEASEEVLVAVEGEDLFLVFGRSHQIGTLAYIWAVATPAVERHRTAIFRVGRRTLKQWFRSQPTLETLANFTFAHNPLHHRWLEWCGAQLFPSAPYGPLGAPFRPFVIKRDFYNV